MDNSLQEFFSFNGQLFIYFDSLTGKFSTRLSRKFQWRYMVFSCDIHYSMTFIILSNWSRTILIIVMIIMIAQLMNSNNDNCDDEHLNNLFFILLDQEKSQVLSSGKSKDLEIGSSAGKELYHLFVCVYCFNGWFIEWALVALNQ